MSRCREPHWAANPNIRLYLLTSICLQKKKKKERGGRLGRLPKNQRDNSYLNRFLHALATSSMQKKIHISILLKFSDYSGKGSVLLGRRLPLPWRNYINSWEEHRPWADAKQEVAASTQVKGGAKLHKYERTETEKMYPTNTSVIKHTVRQFLHKFQTRLQHPSSIHCSQWWDLCLSQGQTIHRVDQFESEN